MLATYLTKCKRILLCTWHILFIDKGSVWYFIKRIEWDFETLCNDDDGKSCQLNFISYFTDPYLTFYLFVPSTYQVIHRIDGADSIMPILKSNCI